jgi:hypothetical protein
MDPAWRRRQLRSWQRGEYALTVLEGNPAAGGAFFRLTELAGPIRTDRYVPTNLSVTIAARRTISKR